MTENIDLKAFFRWFMDRPLLFTVILILLGLLFWSLHSNRYCYEKCSHFYITQMKENGCIPVGRYEEIGIGLKIPGSNESITWEDVKGRWED